MKGRPFTWGKSRGTTHWVKERLDRAVASEDWCLRYEHATVLNMEVLTSNHTTLFVDIEKVRVRAQRGRFMFENAWLHDTGCRDVVIEAWDHSARDALPSRLEHCGV